MGCKSGRTWTREELRLLEQHAGKLGVSELARLLGRSTQSVYNRAMRHGLSLRIVTEDEHDQYLCRELYKAGLSIAVIAQKMEMTRNRVFHIVCQAE
ncbi:MULTISPECIES: hypothetical protein [Mangrovibacter]|uniref:hypothetical protein n=1 Tax=Mangrovibacter TaxID=451512 RepID=UPI0004D5BEDA|nr:hypothetical protein [Mangrovibacter sp. MFB070]KEA51814.1 hypothetical protein DT73_12835 [Mangrovibacter sp. MFB070]